MIGALKTTVTSAVHIKAEVMRWVYSTGTDKPAAKPSNKLSTPGSFFSLFSSLAGITPPRSVVAPLLPPKEEIDPSTINETSVVLSIFSADVHVKLDKKIAVGLHRSTKKNAPGNLKYELIYVSQYRGVHIF